MASTSSSSLARLGNQLKYDVFVSFRGEDIRYGFLTHLSAALHRKSILTFIDDKLEKGEKISGALFKAIKGSKLSIIIFSENFASSTWCLKEVAKIIRYRKRMGQMVVPIFYHVDPSHVRKQSGSFAEAFAKHERKCKMEEVEKWRAALTKAANLSGWHSVSKTSSEFKLVEDIVRDVLKKLNHISLSDSEGLVGIHSRVERMESLLCIGMDDVRTVGIWGMGGIGKTTVAEITFHQIASQFEGCCFLTNVREESQKYGLSHLQEKLLSNILEGEKFNTASSNIGHRSFIKERLQRFKVLIVLDDVDNIEQLESLVGGSEFFGPGSRIILTSRNKQVFQGRVDEIYEVEVLSDIDAFQLFNQYAFRQNHPTEDYKELSGKVVDYAKGNPLALKVLGSSLIGKSKHDWESALNKLERIPPDDIQKKLRISFDGLDKEEQRIFLDIACFFKGEDKHYVTKILDGCGFYTQIGISVLIDKSLITIKGEMLWMHDLLQEMGRSIAFEESEEPGERCRLWVPKDSYDVLKKNKGTKAVEGIILDLCGRNDIHFRSDTFAMMVRLRVLKIYDSNRLYRDFGHDSKMYCKVHLPKEGLECLPDELRCLWWHGYPLKSLPSNFDSENLVYLDLRYSHIEKPWKGVKHLPQLNFIDLSHSQHLTKTSDFSNAPNIERIILEGCTGLRKVHPSIGALDNLKVLHLNGCKEVRSFPRNVHLKSLEILDLSDCSNLKRFPEILGKMEHLWKLLLGGTAIDELPSSIENLTGLWSLELDDCKRLKSLPSSIGQLKSLEHLTLSGCSELESLPSSICNLISLDDLFLGGCSKLESLPCFYSGQNFTGLPCCECEISRDHGFLSSLKSLKLSGSDMGSIPACIKTLPQLQYLFLDNCKRLRSLPEPPPCIKKLDARNCTSLKSVTFLSSLSLLPPAECTNYWVFNFTNCIELDQDQRKNILEAATRQIQLIATPLLEQNHQESNLEPGPHPLLSVFIPGSEIPEWFQDQRMGESVNIQLPPNWLNSRFMEFVVCAVLECKDVIQNPYCFLHCVCTFKTEHGEQSVDVWFPSWENEGGDRLLKTDHMFLGYAALLDEWPSKCCPTEASFKFCIPDDEEEVYQQCKVKKCGVHLIYDQDEKGCSMISQGSSPSEKFKVSDGDFGQSMIKGTNMKRERDDCCYDEAKTSGCGSCKGEQPSKRRKKNKKKN